MTEEHEPGRAPPRRSASVWLQVLIGPAPATLFIAPRLLRWAWLFAFGLTMRLEASRASAHSTHSVLLSVYYLGWALSGVIGIVCLWAAVLADRVTLRRRPWLRGLILAGLLVGLAAVAQFILHPLAAVSFRRQPWVFLLLAAPVVIALYQGWLLLRPVRAPAAGEQMF